MGIGYLSKSYIEGTALVWQIAANDYQEGAYGSAIAIGLGAAILSIGAIVLVAPIPLYFWENRQIEIKEQREEKAARRLKELNEAKQAALGGREVASSEIDKLNYDMKELSVTGFKAEFSIFTSEVMQGNKNQFLSLHYFYSYGGMRYQECKIYPLEPKEASS